MPPERQGLFPAFAGVALADILANSVAIVMIMIVVTLMARYESEKDKLEQADEVAVLLSRELATSFVMNALPTSPPAQLHDYVTWPMDRNPQHAMMPIIELHRDFVRNYYTGQTFSRDELLLQDNAFDVYLKSLSPAQLNAIRVDVYAVDQYYIAMSILKAHGNRPRHWHFLGSDGAGAGGIPGYLADRGALSGREAADGSPGSGMLDRGGLAGAGAALPEDVAVARTRGADRHYPADQVAFRGGGGAADATFFDLPGGTGADSDGDRPPAASTPVRQRGSAGGGSRSFRAARPAAQGATSWMDLDIDHVLLLRALYAYMAGVQADADAGLPSRLPRYDFARDVVRRTTELAPATPEEERLFEVLAFLLARPSAPEPDANGAFGPGPGLAIRQREVADMSGQALAPFPHEPLDAVRWLRNPDQPELTLFDDRTLVTLRLGTHAEIHEGIRVALNQDTLLLTLPPGADRAPRWRVVTLVNAMRSDFVTGFLYAGFDNAGRLILPADENAIDVGGLRVESTKPPVALRAETRQVVMYALIALLFAVGLTMHYRRPA